MANCSRSCYESVLVLQRKIAALKVERISVYIQLLVGQDHSSYNKFAVQRPRSKLSKGKFMEVLHL